MALSLQQFLKKPPREEKICGCGQLLAGADPHPSRVIDGEEVCGDCQTNQLSDLIDQHPIGRPMSRI